MNEDDKKFLAGATNDHEMEQVAASIANLARMMGVYYRELLAHAVPESAAETMVIAASAAYWTRQFNPPPPHAPAS